MTCNISLIGKLLLIPATVFLTRCSNPPTVRSVPPFQHALATEATPWYHDRFDDAEDRFTFAIFSDLNGGEREGVFEVAMAQLSLLRPELILSVGDLIDGGSEDRGKLAGDWDLLDARTSQAHAPALSTARELRHQDHLQERNMMYEFLAVPFLTPQ